MGPKQKRPAGECEEAADEPQAKRGRGGGGRGQGRKKTAPALGGEGGASMKQKDLFGNTVGESSKPPAPDLASLLGARASGAARSSSPAPVPAAAPAFESNQELGDAWHSLIGFGDDEVSACFEPFWTGLGLPTIVCGRVFSCGSARAAAELEPPCQTPNPNGEGRPDATLTTAACVSQTDPVKVEEVLKANKRPAEIKVV